MSVAEARAAMLRASAPLEHERVSLGEALGRTLAAPLTARRDQPPFRAAAMDGYALAGGAAPGDFLIVGEARAGRGFARPLGDGEAVRISTGAPLPEGADAVLIQEDARIEGARLVGAHAVPGRHVRPRGGDFKAGGELLPRGRLLDPVALALAASAGAPALDVVRRPRVAVIAGGDEIAPPGVEPREDQVFESCSFAVAGFVERWGGAALRLPPPPDDQAAIAEAARAALATSDLLVLIGGASVGPHDHARAALLTLGATLLVDKVAVRPGKPTWFAASPLGPVLGLPGNPASAVVCALLFLRPIMEALLGRDSGAFVKPREAVLAEALPSNGGRETYLRARLGEDGALTAFADQDSSLLSVFARADALIVRAPHAPAAEAGDAAIYLPVM